MGPPACSAGAWSTTPCRSRAGPAGTSTTTGWRSWRWRWATSPTSIGRSTTTSSIRAPSSGARPPSRRGARTPGGPRTWLAASARLLRPLALRLLQPLPAARVPRPGPARTLRGRAHPAQAPSAAAHARAARSPLAFAWLAARPARALAGRNETLGVEAAPGPGNPLAPPDRPATRRRERPGGPARRRARPPRSTRKASGRGSDAGWRAR